MVRSNLHGARDDPHTLGNCGAGLLRNAWGRPGHETPGSDAPVLRPRLAGRDNWAVRRWNARSRYVHLQRLSPGLEFDPDAGCHCPALWRPINRSRTPAPESASDPFNWRLPPLVGPFL